MKSYPFQRHTQLSTLSVVPYFNFNDSLTASLNRINKSRPSNRQIAYTAYQSCIQPRPRPSIDWIKVVCGQIIYQSHNNPIGKTLPACVHLHRHPTPGDFFLDISVNRFIDIFFKSPTPLPTERRIILCGCSLLRQHVNVSRPDDWADGGLMS